MKGCVNSICHIISPLVLYYVFTTTGHWANATIIEDIIKGGLQEPSPTIPMSGPEIIRYYGYPCEIHHANSSNYRLEMHRIPRGLNESNPSKGLSVLLVHGVTGTSDIFVENGPRLSISYVLADHGYDVWLGNVRGNHYSLFNYNISKDNPDFWKFSFDEHIDGDLPSMIDFILNMTGTKELYLLGHSSGNLITLGLLASKPDYNSKVKAVITLGVPLIAPTPIQDFLSLIFSDITALIMGFIPDGPFRERLDPMSFQNRVMNLLKNIEFLINTNIGFGDKAEAYDQELLTNDIAHSSSSASIRVVMHVIQMACGFKKYDFGNIKNMQIYNQPDPPLYNLKAVIAPTFIYAARNDRIAGLEIGQLVGAAISNCKGVFQVGSSYSGHLWLFMGKDIDKALFPHVLEAMNSV